MTHIDSEFKDTKTILSLAAFSKAVLAYADCVTSHFLPKHFSLLHSGTEVGTAVRWTGLGNRPNLLSFNYIYTSSQFRCNQVPAQRGSAKQLHVAACDFTQRRNFVFELGSEVLQCKASPKVLRNPAVSLWGQKSFIGTAKQKQSTQLTNYTGQITPLPA